MKTALARLALAGALACLPSLSAQITLEASDRTAQAVIAWPAAKRPPIEVSEYSLRFDGHPVAMLSLRMGDLAIELANRPDLSIQRASSARHSAQLSSQRLPGLVIGIATFAPDEFLPDLGEQSWNAYKASLPAAHPGSQIIFENNNLEGPATPYLLGAKFRQIAYAVDSNPNSLVRRELFAFVQGRLLVLSLYGSRDAIEANWTAADRFLSELSLP